MSTSKENLILSEREITDICKNKILFSQKKFTLEKFSCNYWHYVKFA